MKFLSFKSKENGLFLIGAAIFCCALVVYIYLLVFNYNEILRSSRMNYDVSYAKFVITAIFLAPIWEEIAFRAHFLSSIFWKRISFIVLFLYLLTTNQPFLFFGFILLLVLHHYRAKNAVFLYGFSAFFFAICHYQLNDFKSIYTIVPMFFQLSIGLILTWIVLNFNLVKAILFHFSFNLILVVLLTIPLQFVDRAEKSVIVDGYRISWQQVPILNFNKSNIRLKSNSSLSAVNTELIAIVEVLDLDKRKIKINSNYSFSKLNVRIERIDVTQKKTLEKLSEKILLKAGLISLR